MGKRPLPVSDHTQLEGGRGFGCLVLHFCHMHGKGFFSFLFSKQRVVAVAREGGPLGGPVSIKTALFLLLLERNPEAGMTPPPCPPGRVRRWGLLIPLGRRPTRRKQGK